MSLRVELSREIYWLGFNDRKKHLFENHWPLDKGVAYNAYLVVDEKTALIDTAEAPFSGDLVDWIKELLNGKTLDYLVVNHMEPDHSGSIREVVQAYPNVILIGNKKTKPMIEGFYGITENFQEIEEAEVLSLGSRSLQFFTIPMVHWPESMVTYCPEEKILFSNDAFGSFGAHCGGIFDNEIDFAWYEDEIARYYSNIVAKYGAQVQKALQKLGGLAIEQIAPSHGIIWKTKIPYILEKYDKWSKFEADKGVVIVFGTMYGNTEKIADYIARFLVEEGITNVKVIDAAKTHESYIINEIFKYKGVVLGSCAYNGGIFPPMAHIMSDLEHINIRNRKLAIFGSSSWGGGGVRAIQKFAENVDWDIVSEPSEARHTAKYDDICICRGIAKAMADSLK